MGNEWQVFGAVAALMATWTLLIFGVLKSLLAKSSKEMDDKIDRALSRMIVQDTKTQELEKSILMLKADLPLNYLRKEDFVRHEVVINTKLDRLRDLIEQMKEDWRNKYGK